MGSQSLLLTPFGCQGQFLTALAFEKAVLFCIPVLFVSEKNYQFSASMTLENYTNRILFPTTLHTSPPSRFFRASSPSERPG